MHSDIKHFLEIQWQASLRILGCRQKQMQKVVNVSYTQRQHIQHLWSDGNTTV